MRHTWLIHADSECEVALIHIAGSGTGQECGRGNVGSGDGQQLQAALAMAVRITDSDKQHDIVSGRLQAGTPLAVQPRVCTCSTMKMMGTLHA